MALQRLPPLPRRLGASARAASALSEALRGIREEAREVPMSSVYCLV